MSPTREIQDKLPLTPLSFEVLLSLADQPRHGYGIIKEIEDRTATALSSSTGTLYLALQRLVKEGLVAGVEDGKGKRGRTYQLTPLGRDVAVAEADRLASLVGSARRKSLLSKAGLESALEPAAPERR